MITRSFRVIGGSVGLLLLSGLQTRAVEITTKEVLIEAKYTDVSSTLTTEMINRIPISRGQLPILPIGQLQPLGVLSPLQTQDSLTFLEEVGKIQVITAPKIVTGSSERTTIRVGGEAPTFHVVATIKPDGSTTMSIAPGMAPIVIPPGDTLLLGKKVPGPGPKRDNLYFLTPKYNLTPTTGRGSYTGATGPSQIGQVRQSWNGPYVGIQWGYTRAGSDYIAKLTGDFNHFPEVKDEVEFESRHEFDENGFGLGGCVGYNYEFNNRWIFGVGLAGRKLWGLDGKRETGDFDVSKFGMFDVRQRFKTTYLVTAGPKIGRDFGNYFPYVSGGLAFGEVDPRQTILSTNFGPPQVGRVNEIQAGWYVGAGVQYRLPGNWSNWSLRAEYNYADLGTIKYPGVSEGNRSFAVWNFTTLNEHSLNGGIVYNFGSLISSPGH